jgi:mannose-6-phosphate isomerase-like protein (cupin superfamily)
VAIKVNREDVRPESSDEATTWRFLRRTDALGVGVGIAEFTTLPEGTDPFARCEAHDVPEVHYVLSGRGVLLEDGEEIELRTGDAVVTPAGVGHTLWSVGTDPLVTLYVAIQGTGPA